METNQGEEELPLTEHDDCTHWIGRMKNEPAADTKEHTRGEGKPSANQHVHQKSATGHRRS